MAGSRRSVGCPVAGHTAAGSRAERPLGQLGSSVITAGSNGAASRRASSCRAAARFMARCVAAAASCSLSGFARNSTAPWRIAAMAADQNHSSATGLAQVCQRNLVRSVVISASRSMPLRAGMQMSVISSGMSGFAPANFNAASAVLATNTLRPKARGPTAAPHWRSRR